MSKSIASYPESMRATVVARRMRQYNPKGGNGIGVLAAYDHYSKHLNGHPEAIKHEAPSDIRRRERRSKKNG